VVQNHLLQVIALLAMDAPVGRDPESMRAEKLRLFRAMRPLDPARVVRGHFRGYRDEAGVAADSRVETFVALCLHIDTWRWAGVPFYIRAGKCLPITATEVVVDPKCPPLAIFDEISPATSNYFRFRLSPEVVISAALDTPRRGRQRIDVVEGVVERQRGVDCALEAAGAQDRLRSDAPSARRCPRD
jgi:glucose-6-phosphate 1-dehydrogenase